MIHDLKPYPAYKDSGVPWLGDVPEHWEVVPISRIGQLFKGNGGNKEDEVPSGVPCVRYGELYTRYEFFIRSTKACVAADRAASYTPIQYSDVLFAASGETIEDIGRSAVNLLNEAACCGGDILLLRPEVTVNPIFLGYVADAAPSKHQKGGMGRGFTVVHIYASQLKRLMISLPPLSEQSAIVRYIDYMDRRIRRYIHAKQKLIRLLEEQKQAIIHRAVTRGLDPNVKLKPSGVEWLGDVPERWEIKPAKRYYREIDERSSSGSEELLSVSHLTGVTPRSEKNITMFMAESYVGYKLCRENDLVINTMWAWAGALGVSKQTGIVSYSYAVYSPIQEDIFIHQFIDLLLRTKPYVDEYTRRSTGIRSSRLRLYPEIFLRIPIICPPITEQRTILEYIVNSTSNIESAIQSAQREIALLREYRTRLIADVVTGKLDVREAAASLPDEVAESELLEDTCDESEEIMDIEHQERVYDLGDGDDA